MITIRNATMDDAPVLEDLYRELEEDGVFYQPQHFVLSPKGARSVYLKGILESDTQAMFVAEEEGKVIGFAHLMLLKAKPFSCLKPETALYLQDLVVTAEYRNRGIGSMFMEKAKEYGRENGADFFRTQVFPGNTDGLRFYKRNGFTETMITIESPL
ncbi:MAG: GNAT family N-acetyltransferase [Clostridiales bacterium]|nr:GNAT family N-acetyltransferase [Clostridiales bacterium]